MNLKLTFLVASCAVLAAGCSSVPTRVDKGPLQASTYSFMTSKAPQTALVNEQREAVHKEIQDAIASQLEQRGLRSVASGGHLQVGYLVIVADNATTATYDEYFGYGRDAADLANKAHKAVSKRNSRNLFEVGAIVVDLVDGRNSTLLYRSTAYMDVTDVTPATRTDRINTLVASCLGSLSVRN